MYSHQFIFFFQWNLNFRVHRKKEYYISLHQQSIIKFLKRNSKLFVMNRRRHIFHGIWTCLFMVYSTHRASQYRSIIIDMLIILPLFLLLAGWSFFPENVENCREIKGGWFHLSKRKRWTKAFSWEKAEKDGKGIVSCQVYDVFLISFIDVMGIHVSGWYILIFADMVVVKLQ